MVALTLIALLLGHDLLMAAPLPAPARSDLHGAASEHRQTHEDAPASPHPATCGTTGEAVARAADAGIPGPAVISLPGATALVPNVQWKSLAALAPPGRPPDRARALLQVYRI
ncbi:MAG: hypothetical protein QM692_20280 [Thermomicrobiales bacterium]